MIARIATCTVCYTRANANPVLNGPESEPNRTALAREARRIAAAVEGLYIQLEQVGALARVRHYMVTHQEGVPQFDMLQAAKALRCYAGVLSLIASARRSPDQSIPRKSVSSFPA
jgi:hypothetical protein